MAPELIRKAVHALLALVIAYAASFMSPTAIVLIGLGLLAAFLGNIRKRYFLTLYKVDRRSYGELYFALGIVVSALLFLPAHLMAFQAGMVVLGLADSLAALTGRRYGRHVYLLWGQRRSYEGSFVFLVVTTGIMIAWGASPLFALTAAGVLAAVEVLSPSGSDNLTIPLVAGVLLIV